MDVATDLQAGIDRANAITEMPAGDGLLLSGRFDKSGAATMETARDGLLIQLPLEGELMIRAEAAKAASVIVRDGSATRSSAVATPPIVVPAR
jgi:hypothetical protein